MMNTIKTERLTLRTWLESDKPLFAKMNADPEVMRYFPHPLSRTSSDDLVDGLNVSISRDGYGFWAVDLAANNEFIGFIGIRRIESGLPFSPCVEIGWRLRKSCWGQGFATEGALASLEHGFQSIGLDEVVSMTSTNNAQSEKVMRRIGMRQADNFYHPALPVNHPLSEHVLYTLTQDQWLQPQDKLLL